MHKKCTIITQWITDELQSLILQYTYCIYSCVVGFISVRKNWWAAQFYEVETCLTNGRNLHSLVDSDLM